MGIEFFQDFLIKDFSKLDGTAKRERRIQQSILITTKLSKSKHHVYTEIDERFSAGVFSLVISHSLVIFNNLTQRDLNFYRVFLLRIASIYSGLDYSFANYKVQLGIHSNYTTWINCRLAYSIILIKPY